MPHAESRASESQQSTERDAGDSTAQKEVDCWLLRSDFYHGYLPREDVVGLLKGHGDFLVRLSEKVKVTANKQQQKQTSNIISVLVDEENRSTTMQERERKIKHIVVYHRGGKWYLEDALKFDSAALLFAYYMERPLVRDNVSILLQRGVRLCRWEYFHRNVKVMRVIGKGAYGEVKLAELHKRNGSIVTVAAKTVSQENGVSPKKVKEMLKEARIMRGLRHPNIVSFIGVVLIDHPIYIILELMQGGALDAYLRKNQKRVTSDERLRFAMGVAWGMEYLHGAKILHRDLAARNCLYDGKLYVKISDFGLSKKGTTYKMKAIQKMPVRYMAPESLQQYMFTQKTDVYTYGILIYEIYTCMEPYHDVPSAQIKSTILSGTLNKLPNSMPSSLKIYVEEKIWNKNPTERPDFSKIVKVLEQLSGLKLTTQAFDDVSLLANDITRSKAPQKRAKRKSRVAKLPYLRIKRWIEDTWRLERGSRKHNQFDMKETSIHRNP
ncbi:Tyrosine-protein kinase [Trichostrongylus colubriformis]|uniref:Tyrosine-protein kinase n=1 Tax=Trichostrongylus colubriformis TaxID=6319 RepID=A0AAN8F3R8_TRICO